MNVNPEIFRCDEDDTSRLCYSKRVFQSDKQARNFLDYQFGPADDCQVSNTLGVRISNATGTCHNTMYKLTPFQDITSCNGTAPAGFFEIPFENPLFGREKEVTVQVDEEPPKVQCGFHDIDHINVVDGQTLFFYVGQEEEGGLEDANFFYNITVCASLLLLLRMWIITCMIQYHVERLHSTNFVSALLNSYSRERITATQM